MAENFIRSLVQYLRDRITTSTFYANSWPAGRAVPAVLVREMGGERRFHGIRNYAVNILVEDDDPSDCRTRIYEIFDSLLDGKGITLPATVTGDSPIVAEVVDIPGLPSPLGESERGRFQWTFNMIARC